MSETTFRYFANPHAFSTYTDEPTKCDVCRLTKPGYKGPFYGEIEIDFVCEDCLATGRLVPLDVTTNEGDQAKLSEQLRQLQSKVPEDQIQALVRERTMELEHRTPQVVTWQPFFWPAHHGDYCLFIKEAGKLDLKALAPDGDGRKFFAEHLYDDSDTDVQWVWETIRPDPPTSSHGAYSTGVYLFRCLECGEHLILWDFD
jgi:uncharacterized protein CbrC (UPF0167 family)